MAYFYEDSFRDLMLALAVKDTIFLRTCERFLSPQDFKPEQNSGKGKAQWIIAKIAFQYYARYRSPIKDMIKAEVLDYCKINKIEGEGKETLIKYSRKLYKKEVGSPQSVIDKVLQYKKTQAKKAAVKEIIELQSSGKLTDEKWLEITQKATAIASGEQFLPIDYFDKLADRIERRDNQTEDRFPVIFIDDLDAEVRLIPRGSLGLVLAPYKRGKSLMLIHIAKSLCLQGYNGIYITLEDPLSEVEDRFDASITFLPVRELSKMKGTLKKRFRRFKRLLRSRLKIIDGTGGGVTVNVIDGIYEQQRNSGFTADFICVDYDAELEPTKVYREKRMASDEIYRDLRRFSAKKYIWLWTAAQSKRGTRSSSIISGDDVAEDISKIQKSGVVLSLGSGKAEGSIYLNIAASKFDRQDIGCTIMPDLKRMQIYSRELTAKMKAANPVAEER